MMSSHFGSIHQQLPYKQDKHSHAPWWLLLCVGFVFGKVDISDDLLERFQLLIEKVVVPLYCFVVFIFLFGELLCGLTLVPILKLFKPQPPPEPVITITKEVVEEKLDGDQPVDLTGAYKFVSSDNFDAFLTVQGVPWALRRAAVQARPVHRITHNGNSLTIRIEAMVTSETTYIINGPAVETNVRGRIFEDRVSYLENGVQVHKTAITEGYEIYVRRVLTEDKKRIHLTGLAEFKDGREPVEMSQVFERVEEE